MNPFKSSSFDIEFLQTKNFVELRTTRSILVLAIVAFSSGLPAAQDNLHVVPGDSVNDNFGNTVSDVGDVNGDGYADWAVGAAQDDDNGSNCGSIRVFSGADGTILYTRYGDASGDFLGSAIAAIGDVDNDGNDDLLVGAYGDDENGNFAGSARVYSGIDGTVLYDLLGDETDNQFGRSVTGLGDLNGDGHNDFAIAAAGTLTLSTGLAGFVRVFSGIDGSVMYELAETNIGGLFGREIQSLGDLSGDGLRDMAVLESHYVEDGTGFILRSDVYVHSGLDGKELFSIAAPLGETFTIDSAGDVNRDGYDDILFGNQESDVNGTDSGSIHVISGFDQSTIYTIHSDVAFDRFGTSVAGVGDVDGDGYPDFAGGAPFADFFGQNDGVVRVYSGRDGSLLKELRGDTGNDKYGTDIAGIGDSNADGLPDIVVGAPKDFFGGIQVGRVFVVSTAPVTTIDESISLSAADSAAIDIDYGIGRAGHVYWVFGSATGKFPGITFPGDIHLPLNFDAYFNLTLKRPFASVFGNFLSTLDGAGVAHAALISPAGADPALVGITLHHAIVVGPILGVIDGASNAIPVTFVP